MEFQVQIQMTIVPILALLLVSFFIGIAFLWKKGKTTEGIALLNTLLLLIIIILLLFPPA